MPNPPTDIMETLDRWMRDPRPIHPRDADAIHLAQLEADGCTFTGDPVHGLTLAHVGLGCHGEYLAWATGCQPVQVYHQTQSTQDVCRRIVASQNPATASSGSWGAGGTEHAIPRGPLVLSDEQTAGRGRLGRRWLAPPGQAALFSFATTPGTPGSGFPGHTARGRDSPPSSSTHVAPSGGGGSGGGERLALAAAVAVAEVLAEALSGTGHQPVIKWPNDTLVDGKKLAGVLIETEQTPGGGQVAIVGIGINVGVDAVDPSLVHQATSLHRLGSRVHRLALVADVVNALHRAANTDPADLLKRWRERCLLPDSVQTLTHNGQTLTGHVIDLDPDHGLILRTQEGQIVYLPAATTSTKAMDD